MKRLLIVGCGDIALRALPQLARSYQVFGLVRASDQAGRSAARGRLVYISTSAVYGDCGGAWVDEDRPLAPQSPRGARRADAERTLLDWGEQSGVAVAVLRVPGIYAAERLPLAQLQRDAPVLREEDDVYTNHIHADDLAAICATALAHAARGRAYNASDDSEIKMGDYFDLVADRAGLPRPPRISRAAAEAGAISPGLLSFMRESRRLVNTRMKTELGVRLRYPSVYDGVPKSATNCIAGGAMAGLLVVANLPDRASAERLAALLIEQR